MKLLSGGWPDLSVWDYLFLWGFVWMLLVKVLEDVQRKGLIEEREKPVQLTFDKRLKKLLFLMLTEELQHLTCAHSKFYSKLNDFNIEFYESCEDKVMPRFQSLLPWIPWIHLDDLNFSNLRQGQSSTPSLPFSPGTSQFYMTSFQLGILRTPKISHLPIQGCLDQLFHYGRVLLGNICQEDQPRKYLKWSFLPFIMAFPRGHTLVENWWGVTSFSPYFHSG